MKKLFAFDLDGTLLDKHHKIVPETISELERLYKKGHLIVIATGRGKMAIDNVVQQLPFNPIVIGNNGTFIHDFETHTSEVMGTLPQNVIDFMFEESVKVGSWLVFHNLDGIKILDNNKEKISEIDVDDMSANSGGAPVYSNEKDFFNDINLKNVLQITIRSNPQKTQTLMEDTPEAITSQANFFEASRIHYIANPKGIDKFVAIKRIANNHGIDVQDITCFGDSNNDVSMINHAGTGVAMGNATKSLKTIADVVIGNHNTTAIADYLKNIK